MRISGFTAPAIALDSLLRLDAFGGLDGETRERPHRRRQSALPRIHDARVRVAWRRGSHRARLRPVAALDRIRAEKPDLVVLDVKMPDLDGFGVLSMLRGEGNPVPVVMCSGSALAEGRRPRLCRRLQRLCREAGDAGRLSRHGRRDRGILAQGRTAQALADIFAFDPGADVPMQRTVDTYLHLPRRRYFSAIELHAVAIGTHRGGRASHRLRLRLRAAADHHSRLSRRCGRARPSPSCCCR